MNLRRGRELEEYAIDLPCSLRDEGKEERRIDLEKAIRLYEIYLAAGRPGERELLKSDFEGDTGRDGMLRMRRG